MKIKKYAAFFLLVLFTLMISFPGKCLAAENKTGSIQITELATSTQKPVPGIRLTIYRVAEGIRAENSAHLTPDFADSGLQLTADILSDSDVASDLVSQYIQVKKLSGLEEKTTDASGIVEFTDLSCGIYLIVQSNTEEDFEKLGYTAEASPYFVEIPMPDSDHGGAYLYNVSCKPKCDVHENKKETVDISVYKEWKDNSNKAGKRPESIKVSLYYVDPAKNKRIDVDTQTLSAENNWSYIWKELDAKIDWKVREIDVPENYKMTKKMEGTVCTIINTYTPPTTPPGTPPSTPPGTSSKTSPKTGDEAPILQYLILLLAAGTAAGILLRNKRKE